MKSMSRLIACWLGAVCLIAGSAAAEVEGTITTRTDGRMYSGLIRWKPASKIYEVRQANTAVTLTLDKVAAVKAKAPPPGLEGLIKQVQTGSAGAAIPGLEQIVKTYEMVEYDLVAARWLSEGLVKGGKATEAVRVCDQAAQYRPKAALTMDFVKAYWDALQAARQYAKLEEEISGAIAEGARDVAAVAQNKRGDLKVEKKEFKDALVDGYLRTVILFEDVKGAQPEALFKAALCFDQLGQATYAERMRKKLLADFPQDAYVNQLKSGS